MAKTRAQENKAIRQEALREQLSNKGLIQQVLVDIEKIDKLASIKIDDYEDPDHYLAEMSTSKDKAGIIKLAIDSRMKVVNKYLPDLKSTELTGDSENPLIVTAPVIFSGAS